MKNHNKEWRDQLMNDCEILYCKRNASMRETCMCWSFDCGNGWKEPLRKLSYALETLNLQYYPKYNIRIQADQVKEKYGTLRFYYSVIEDACKPARIVYSIVNKINSILRNVDYHKVKIVDVPEWIEHEVAEIDKEQYEYCRSLHISNVKVEEKNGKYYKYAELVHTEKWHFAPTKHKFLNKLSIIAEKVCSFLSSLKISSKASSVIIENLSNIADELIMKAEAECNAVCETCGTSIAGKYSVPKCETKGWVSYVCEDCAIESKSTYYKNGALWHDGKCIKTKEEVDAEMKKICEEYEAETC